MRYMGPSFMKEELSGILQFNCISCFIMGPMVQEKNLEMSCVGENVWQCAQCLEGKNSEILKLVHQAAEKLGQGTEEHDDRLRPAIIHEGEGSSRVVFMPTCLLGDLTVEEHCKTLDPRKVTVLVPRNPDALDEITDSACQRALEEKNALRELTKFFSQRFIFTDLSTMLTILYRKKLADIKSDRINLLTIMKSTSRGPITSRNPKKGKIMNRNPHYAATKGQSLTNTCTWSDGYKEKTSGESEAIAAANGQVKTKVTCEILNNVAQHNEDLKVALWKTFASRGREKEGIIPTAPVVLQFLRAKVKLLMKHVVQQMYEHWDLQLCFKRDSWTVELVGFLYSSQYNDINKKIATEGITLQEIVDVSLRNPEIQPTATLDEQTLKDFYGVREEEAEVSFTLRQDCQYRKKSKSKNKCIASHSFSPFFMPQVIAALARIHQNDGLPQPLSMVTMYTPSGIEASPTEKLFRRRAIQPRCLLHRCGDCNCRNPQNGRSRNIGRCGRNSENNRRST